MREFLLSFASGIAPEYALFVYTALVFVIIVFTAVVVHLLLHKVVFKIIQKQTSIVSRLLASDNLFTRLSLLFQGAIVYLQAEVWVDHHTTQEILLNASLMWILFFALLTSYSIIDMLFKSLHRFTNSQFFEIRSVIQSIKLILTIVFAIYLISLLAGKSPVAILSGLGAMSAVLMLVFKDTILGFTAGLQLSTNKMVELGDWIEMPKYGADGDVIDIGLNVVKVRNWDKTITTIPTYALVSDSFKNWRGMRESGGRRIKRSLQIDISSIHFLSDEEKQRLTKASLIAPYLKAKDEELASYNKSHDFDMSTVINGRRLTNLGTLRAYILTYLKNHAGINQEMIIMVRQLQPNHYGLPLEIYCFTATTNWVEYENTQSDIFDHIFAVLDEFGLKAYQVGVGS